MYMLTYSIVHMKNNINDLIYSRHYVNNSSDNNFPTCFEIIGAVGVKKNIKNLNFSSVEQKMYLSDNSKRSQFHALISARSRFPC